MRHRVGNGIFALIAALALSAGFAGMAVAAPSDLDASFDGDGKLTTAIGSSADRANAIAIQPDGRTVVAGYSTIGSNDDFALARYNADGSLDNGFDGDGKLTTAIGASSDLANAIAIQPDGKIVVAGSSYNGSENDFALARYNANGSPDAGFGGGDGKLTTAIGAGNETAFAVAIQPDGKIVVTGISDSGGGNYDFALARYNADGSPDAGFGGGDGELTTAIGADDDNAYAMALEPNGKIVAAGYSIVGGNRDFALARYNTNGTLDTGFDGDGKLTTAIGTAGEEVIGIAIQPDGKIVAAGSSNNGSNDDFALVRYDANGSPDAGFGGGDGKVTTAIGTGADIAYAIAIQPNGKIVTAGYSDNGSDTDFALVRYNPDSSLDTGFDGDGKLTTAIGSSDDDATGVAIQPDGKIVVAGYSDIGSERDFALARYMGDPPPLAAPPAPVAPAIPTAKITRPAHRRIRSKVLKAFAGTAGPAGNVAKVEIALRRVDRRQLKRGRCLWLRNSKAKFVKTKAERKKCAKQRFLLAKGTEKWSFKLRKRLPKARYELYVRVTLKTGERHTTFTKAQGNLLVFSVI